MTSVQLSTSEKKSKQIADMTLALIRGEKPENLHDSFGSQVHRLFEQDFAGSRRITLDEHARRGLGLRLLELLLRPINWFL